MKFLLIGYFGILFQ